MAFIPVPNTAMVELLLTLDGQRCENTLYFNQDDDWTVAQLETLAGEVGDWWNSNVAPLVADDVTLRGVKATSLESDTAPSVEVARTDTGDLTSPALPNNVSFTVKFLTGGRGRSSRGRNYIVGLTEVEVTGNMLDGSTAAAFVEGYDALLDPATISVGTWVVVSRFLDNAPRATGIAQPITGSTFTDLVIDSQRRRLPGRGT